MRLNLKPWQNEQPMSTTPRMQPLPEDDDGFFPDDLPEDTGPQAEPQTSWPILIVDDEPGIHAVTRLALKGVRFQNRPLELISAMSAQEAMEILRSRDDIAVALLDVVMETEDAGLELVKAIREDLQNRRIRIVLRTGQPGVAPEREVIETYDINDYRAKTDLTRDRLFTAVLGSLRSYDDLMTIEHSRRVIDANRRGLIRIIDASSTIFRVQSPTDFAQGVLDQLQALLFAEADGMPGQPLPAGGFAAMEDAGTVTLLAASGAYAHHRGKSLDEVADLRSRAMIDQALRERRSIAVEDRYVGLIAGEHGGTGVLFIDGPVSLLPPDQELVDLFCANVGIAFDNLLLKNEVEATQRDVIYKLGGVVEYRSRETGNHVRRVAEYTYILARAMGLPEEEAQMLRMASPMHDVGKVGIPDSILNKPARLDDGERDIMRRHAEIGHDMLAGARSRALRAAAILAYEHHEKWDGTGYPRGLKGEEIHLYGRITALADVFDALGSNRVYKRAWDLEQVLDYLRDQRGRHFDPTLVDRFFEHFEAIDAIRRRYGDNAGGDGAG